MKIIFVIFYLFSVLQGFHSDPWAAAVSDGVILLVGILFLVWIDCLKYKSRLKVVWLEIAAICLIVLFALGENQQVSVRAQWPYAITMAVAYVCYKRAVTYLDSAALILVAVGLAGIVSAVFGAIAWWGALQHYDGFSNWLIPIPPDGRWGGNLNQPNNTGTLLLWGLLAVAFWAQHYRRQVFPPIVNVGVYAAMVLAVVIIGFASALVQSRTATLNAVLLVVLVLLNRRLLQSQALRLLLLGCFVHFICIWVLPFWQPQSGAFGGRGLSSSYRLEVWQDLIRAVAAHPWLGYGVGGVTRAFLEHASPAVQYHTYFAHAHNIVLELLLWFGIPFGGFLVLVGAKKIWCVAKSVNSETLLPALMLLVLLVHGMLELPLHYPYFLIPAAILLGWVTGNADTGASKVAFSLPAWVVSIFALLVLLPAFYLLAEDYLQQEQNLRQAKLELAIKGYADPAIPTRFNILWELTDLNEFVRVSDKAVYETEQQKRFHETISRFPGEGVINKGIRIFEYNNNAAYVAYWKQKRCAIYGGKGCSNGKILEPGS